MNDFEKFMTFIGCVLFFGTIAYSLSDEDSNHRRLRRRTLIKDRTGARDLSESSESNKNTEKLKSPSFSDNAVSTISRSSDSNLRSKFLTSKNTGSCTTPSNNLVIRKYPEKYYTLSKKAQWKFRQKITKTKAA